MSESTSVVQTPDEVRSLEEAIDEVKRELDVRRRVYDRWAAEGKVSRTDAKDRFARLFSALYYLEAHERSKAA
jgi:hypothetical protein